ncbi:MAG: response regulator transcription factor [Lachnospiraceae bacterium]|nr:response regulator transcription factor [Lachnospiraceae bacterium]
MTDLYYIEDDPDIAGVVKEYLEQKDFKVTVCGTLEQARQALRIRVPTLVLLDWSMPDGRGDSLCRWIRDRWKELPVIFLTVRGDSCDIVSGFRNGADDYVVKPFALEVLYSRIQALLRRTGNVAKRYLSCGRIVIDVERRTVFCYGGEESGGQILLSAAEYQLLLYLMQNKGKTVTREKILEQVWDVNGNYVNDNTLTVTMKRLRDKLGQPACLKTVRSVGYRMEEGI